MFGFFATASRSADIASATRKEARIARFNRHMPGNMTRFELILVKVGRPL
jgi:hypothetical protein